jgi:ABC-type sugar transport system substrate-binding protein
MSYVLFLDDERMPDKVDWVQFPRYETVYIIRTFEGFVKQVMTYGIPMFVCFDHDLADQHYVAMLAESEGRPADYGTEKTGYDAAKWLVDYCVEKKAKFPRHVVHSMNPIGKERIDGYIENAKQHLGI